MNKSRISIILYTFYRAEMLRATLDWLAEIGMPEKSGVELVVVDNKMYGYKFEKVKPRGVPLRMLLRALLSKVETATKYIEERM